MKSNCTTWTWLPKEITAKTPDKPRSCSCIFERMCTRIWTWKSPVSALQHGLIDSILSPSLSSLLLHSNSGWLALTIPRSWSFCLCHLMRPLSVLFKSYPKQFTCTLLFLYIYITQHHTYGMLKKHSLFW